MTYKSLTVGDIRQKGDEQRSPGVPKLKPYSEDYAADPEWHPTCLVGHPILASDLMHLEYRRAE